jgi:two-component system, sensor histidine kinase and response regulator
MEGDREMCIKAGMNDYIAKPVQKKELEAILMKYSASSGESA